jgi:hypothetical protein
MLLEYEMSAHLAKNAFMLNNILWHQHGEVQSAVADESNGDNDVDRMDDMVADIGRGYDLESKIHHQRCRISTGSLLPQKKKCMKALM